MTSPVQQSPTPSPERSGHAPVPVGAGGDRFRKIRRVSAVTAALTAAAAFIAPLPYVVEYPGPAFNTLGANDGTPMITITGKETYPTSGQLDMVTVYVGGGPGRYVNFPRVLGAWLSKDEAVIPSEMVYPQDATAEQVQQESAAEMVTSKDAAVAAALGYLKIPYTETVSVQEIDPEGPAHGVVRAGDRLRSVEGVDVSSLRDFRDQLAKFPAGRALSIGIERDGKPETITVTPIHEEGEKPRIGVIAQLGYTFPFDVKIQIDDVGGPSAGMMFALGIIDKLTPGDLTGGKHIVGTGTMDPEGNVGPIGGIRQKMATAARDGSSWFLAPADNCDEVLGHVPEGLTAVKVGTLAQAHQAVQDIAAGKDPSTFAQCADPSSTDS